MQFKSPHFKNAAKFVGDLQGAQCSQLNTEQYTLPAVKYKTG